MENLTELIAIIFSALVLLALFLVYLRYEKKLKVQQNKINEQQKLLNRYKEKAAGKDGSQKEKAKFNAYLVGNNEIYIRNIGQATAKNVKVELPPKISVLNSPFPTNVKPDTEKFISIEAGNQSKGVHIIQVSWNDDYETARSEKLHIQL
jgi:hypothetical protein